jgi:NADPH2:quinone reductase
MKAIQVSEFGGPEVLQFVEVPCPGVNANEILVRNHAVGVNPVETYVRAGIYPNLPQVPYIPGSDAAGIVEAVGEGVSAFSPGDRVYVAGTLTGAYAEYAVCDQTRVYALPEHVSFEQGASLGIPYATAYRALFQRGDAKPGEVVLVHGASGAVGLAAIQFARAAGMFVYGTASSEKGRQMVFECGAHGAFDHSRNEHFEEFIGTTGDRGADLIVEMLANVNLDGDLRALAYRGRVIIVGSRGRIEINPRDTMKGDADIRGMVLLNATESELYEIHCAIGAGLANGSLVPVVGQELLLEEAFRAHEAVMLPGACGKIVLIVQQEDGE